MKSIRATQLEKFLNCPFRFRYEPEADPNSEAFKFGTTLHKLVEIYVQWIENQTAVDMLLYPWWVKERKMLKAITEEFIKQIQERNLRYILSEYSTLKQFNENDEQSTTLEGTFDLLFQDKDGKHVIIDIKTASSNWTQEHINGVYQKYIYPALIEWNTWLHIDRFEYWIAKKTLTPTIQQVVYEVEPDVKDKVERFIDEYNEAEETLLFYPKRPNYACFFCKIKKECSNFKHLNDNNDWNLPSDL